MGINKLHTKRISQEEFKKPKLKETLLSLISRC
jgi:hypothetical protein